MDGGSTDQSLQILEHYNRELFYWESNKDRGQAYAINKGFKMATGDIVSWLNSDDKLCKGALNCIAEYFINHPQKHLIHGSGLYFDDKGRHWRTNKSYEDIQARYITHFAFDMQPSVFFRREVFDEIGFLDETFNLQFDSEFFVRIALNYGILKIDEHLSLFRQHDLRKSKLEYPKLEYPHEFVRIYSRVLRSLLATAGYRGIERYTSIAKLLGLFIYDNVKYPVRNTFDQKLLERSFFIFLKRCCGFFYHILDYDRALQILQTLQREFPHHYKSNGELQRIAKRLPITRVLKRMPKGTILRLRELSSMYSNRKYLIK
jgi:glycosyltransferase involved in cell wall biosynthesis